MMRLPCLGNVSRLSRIGAVVGAWSRRRRRCGHVVHDVFIFDSTSCCIVSLGNGCRPFYVRTRAMHRVVVLRSWKRMKLSSQPRVCWIWWYLSICWFWVECLFVFVIWCFMIVLSVLCIIGCFPIRLRANCGSSSTSRAIFDSMIGWPWRDTVRMGHCITVWCRWLLASSDGLLLQRCGGTACCRVCPCTLSLCFSALCEAICFSCAVNNMLHVVGDADNAGRHARETESRANWCAG